MEKQKLIQRYLFPVLLFKHPVIKGRLHFRRLLTQQQIQFPQYAKNFNYHSQGKGIKAVIFIRCKHCEAYIQYKKISEINWVLLKYNNFHRHVTTNAIKKNSNHNDLMFEEMVLQSLYLSNKEIYDKLKLIYHISNMQFFRRKKQIMKNPNFDLLKRVQISCDHNFRYISNPLDKLDSHYPDHFIVISNQQITDFLACGDLITFQVFENCIQQKSYQNQNYSIGIFSAQNKDNNPILLAVTISLFKEQRHYEIIFEWFFEIMNKKQIITSLLTSPNEMIINVLSKLKKKYQMKFHHIYDRDDYIKDFKSKLKSIERQNKAQIISTLTLLIKQLTSIKAMKYLLQLRQLLQQVNMENLLEILTEDLQNLCIWLMPNQFLGISFKFNSRISQSMEYFPKNPIKYFDFITKTKQLIKKSLCTIESYTFQILFNDEQIKNVRRGVSRKVFNYFMQNYRRSQLYSLQSISNLVFTVKHLETGFEQTIKDWQCECGLDKKSGIPCQHLIVCIRQSKIKKQYLSLFHSKWYTQL